MSRYIWLAVDFYTCFFVSKVTQATAQKLSQIRLDLVFGVHEYHNVPYEELFFICFFYQKPLNQNHR